MRRLAEQPELRERIGKQAAADMADRQARLGVSELLGSIDRLLERRRDTAADPTR
jgi:hypothetical protein